ncbi:MAG TPA: hypothetical protein VIG45_02740 [Erysipelothrix sp.]
MNFQIGQEVEIVNIGFLGPTVDKLNVSVGDRGVIKAFYNEYFVLIYNPKFKNSSAGDGFLYVRKGSLIPVKPKFLYEDSGRNKLRMWLKDVCKKYDFTLEQLSVSMGFNESYLSNLGSKSRFEKRGDINSEEYRKLVNNFLVHDYKECRHTIAQLIEQIDSLDDDLRECRVENYKCNRYLEQANKNTEYWMRKLPKTRFQAFKLFIKMMFGGEAV